MGNSGSNNEEKMETEKKMDASEEDLIKRAQLAEAFGNRANSSFKSMPVFPGFKKMWPNDIVPYIIDQSLAGNRSEILHAMRQIEDNCCINFVPRKHEDHYLKITKKYGCYSCETCSPREISIGTGCERFGIILHELLHAIGFGHEHNRPDRDEYLNVYFQNIEPIEEIQFQFRKRQPEEDPFYGIMPFDYDSIMMYGPHTYAREVGLITIEAKDRRRLKTKKNELSELDKKKLALLYNKCKK